LLSFFSGNKKKQNMTPCLNSQKVNETQRVLDNQNFTIASSTIFLKTEHITSFNSLYKPT
ncbi:unnamed protein product, partial [Brassica rapa]